jgi:hypothetical protein
MANTSHAALDGSPVRFEAEADLSAPMTAFGFVQPRGWRRSQAFNVYAAGRADRVQAAVDAGELDIDYTVLDDISHNGGTLRRALVRRPAPTGGVRELVFSVWEGSRSALSTSLPGSNADEVDDLFDRVDFSEIDTGIAMATPVDESVRPLRCLKEVGNTLLEVRPLSPAVTRTLPTQQGRPVNHGEIFRRNQTSRDVLLVTDTAAVYAAPLGSEDEHVDLAASLAVSWGGPPPATPPTTGAPAGIAQPTGPGSALGRLAPHVAPPG